MPAKLILIKHSMPEIVADTPASQWSLSSEGRHRCALLADHLAPLGLDRMISSLEPKACQTAEITARRLDLPLGSFPGLHEHLRTNVPFSTQEAFENSVAELFSNPEKRVFGEESAVEASDRFRGAINQLMQAYPGEKLAVVAHGTVISLYIAGLCKIDPYPLWQRLGLPSFIVVSPFDGKIIQICESVIANK
jgi:broad specificity phosphatase PhoE